MNEHICDKIHEFSLWLLVGHLGTHWKRYISSLLLFCLYKKVASTILPLLLYLILSQMGETVNTYMDTPQNHIPKEMEVPSPQAFHSREGTLL